MGIDAIFDTHNWAVVPFHFWSLCFFTFGCMVGSFLNVCIYRMPLDLSVVSPPSHCPHCKYSIPFYLNIPLVTWLALQGRCKNCGAPISSRYFIVELVTGLAFLSCWLTFGDPNHPLPSLLTAFVYGIFLAGLICATFIDFEHFIIPDEITMGGMGVGFAISFLLPSLHNAKTNAEGMFQGFLGIVVGAGIIYAILRLGKLLFGKYMLDLDPESQVKFTEHAIQFPQKRISLDPLYLRNGWFGFQAKKLELLDRCYIDVALAVSKNQIMLEIPGTAESPGTKETFDRTSIPHLEMYFERQLSSREMAMLIGNRRRPFEAIFQWLYSLLQSSTGRSKTEIFPGAKLAVTTTEAWLYREDQAFGEIFYRKTDAISFFAKRIEAEYRSWRNVPVRITSSQLKIGDDEFNPEGVPSMAIITDRMSLPREAMGFGDVKFMGAIGAFIGWQGAIFSLMFSSLVGAVVGIILIVLHKREWSSRMPYGPYIALAAVVWLFAGEKILAMLFHQ
jgi:prepilin signal peptidase PulO-like enzyme (type II secretory pathway)